MSYWCRIEKATSLAKVRVHVEARIGTAWIVEKLDDLAGRIEQLVQLHLFPVVQAEVARCIRVLASKREVSVTRRLQLNARNWFSVFVEDRDVRIERRFFASCFDFEDPLLACVCIELE